MEAYETMIKKIKIGYQDYVIHELDPQGMGNIDGKFNDKTGEIIIDSSLLPNVKAEILLHEVIHGIWHHFGLDSGGLSPERVVDSIGKGLATVIRDNPEFLSWLEDNLQEGK